MPETYGTRPDDWYAKQAPDKLWGEDDDLDDLRDMEGIEETGELLNEEEGNEHP